MSRKHTFFVHMNATKEWLSLTRKERNLFLEKDFQPLLDKYHSIIEHSRHRSPVNFCVNVLCGLIAYCHQPKKPSLRLDWLLPQSA